MRGVKTMLLGITILLAIIIIHLYVLGRQIVDPLALIGVAVALLGYLTKDEKEEKEENDGTEDKKEPSINPPSDNTDSIHKES